MTRREIAFYFIWTLLWAGLLGGVLWWLVAVDGPLAFVVANAGDAKDGVITVYYR